MRRRRTIRFFDFGGSPRNRGHGGISPHRCIDFFRRFFTKNRSHSSFSKSISGFHFQIATLTAIKNLSGKIDQRFYFFNRFAIFLEKSQSDFHFKTGSRLKNPHRVPSYDGTMIEHDNSDQLNF
jgi:hypothetical protein